jgi:hypothetical protein
VNACPARDLADRDATEAMLGHCLQGGPQHGVADAGGSAARAATHLIRGLARGHGTTLTHRYCINVEVIVLCY